MNRISLPRALDLRRPGRLLSSRGSFWPAGARILGRRAILGFVALSLVACGSTTRQAHGSINAAVNGDGHKVEASKAAGAGLHNGAGGQAGHASTMGEQAGKEQSTQTARTPVTLGQGVTSTTITLGLGIWNSQSANSVLGALGIKETDFGDGRAAAQAVVNFVNAHGGIAGRRVVPVYDDFSPNNGESAEYQKNCATFTEDHKLFAVVNQVDDFDWEILADCLAKHKTIYVWEPRTIVDSAQLKGWAPYAYTPDFLGGNRWGVIVDQLVSASFFGATSKIGVIWAQTNANKRTLESVIKPRLAHYGLKVIEEASYVPEDQVQGIQNAVLRFRQSGVTHVVFVGTFGGAPFFFMPEAESQGYRPRYALTSIELPIVQGKNDPVAQIRNALAVGWWPTADVDWPQDPNDNAAQSICFKIIRDAGVNIPSRTAGRYFGATCDGLFFLKAALGRAPSLTAAGLRTAVNALGDSYQPVLSFGTRFAAGQSDGASLVRLLKFNDGCNCFKYSGTKIAAP